MSALRSLAPKLRGLLAVKWLLLREMLVSALPPVDELQSHVERTSHTNLQYNQVEDDKVGMARALELATSVDAEDLCLLQSSLRPVSHTEATSDDNDFATSANAQVVQGARSSSHDASNGALRLDQAPQENASSHLDAGFLAALQAAAKHLPPELQVLAHPSKVYELLQASGNITARLPAAMHASTDIVGPELTALANTSKLFAIFPDNSTARLVGALQLAAAGLQPNLAMIANASKVWANEHAGMISTLQLPSVHMSSELFEYSNAEKVWETMQSHGHDPSNGTGMHSQHQPQKWSTRPAHAFPHIHVVDRRQRDPAPKYSVPGYDIFANTDAQYGISHKGIVIPSSSTVWLPSDDRGQLVMQPYASPTTFLYDWYFIILGSASLASLAFVGLCMARLWVRRKFLDKQIQVHLTPRVITMSGLALPKHADKQEFVGASDDKTLSVWDGTVATFSSIVGTGLLAMPYAFSVAGLLGGTLAVLLFVGCSAYTGHLMCVTLCEKSEAAKNSKLRAELQGWPFLVEVAFGQKAKIAITAFLIVELWGYLLSTIITSAMNMNQVSESISITSAITITVLVAYGLNQVSPRLLTQLNVASNVCYVTCCLMFVATGLLLPEKAPADDIELVRPHGLISAAGILVFSPAAHSFYPAVMQRMEQPRLYPLCLSRAYTAACVLYLVIAVLGYCLFGNAIQPSIVKNIGVDLHLVPISGLGWMNTMAAVFMVLKMLAMQPLILSPLNSTVEGLLEEHATLMPVVRSAAFTPGLTVVVLAVSAAVSLRFAHQMAVVLNFVGSVFCMTIAFVVPVLCYWKLRRDPLGTMQRLAFCGLLFMGCFFSLIGLTTFFY